MNKNIKIFAGLLLLLGAPQLFCAAAAAAEGSAVRDAAEADTTVEPESAGSDREKLFRTMSARRQQEIENLAKKQNLKQREAAAKGSTSFAFSIKSALGRFTKTGRATNAANDGTLFDGSNPDAVADFNRLSAADRREIARQALSKTTDQFNDETATLNAARNKNLADIIAARSKALAEEDATHAKATKSLMEERDKAVENLTKATKNLQEFQEAFTKQIAELNKTLKESKSNIELPELTTKSDGSFDYETYANKVRELTRDVKNVQVTKLVSGLRRFSASIDEIEANIQDYKDKNSKHDAELRTMQADHEARAAEIIAHHEQLINTSAADHQNAAVEHVTRFNKKIQNIKDVLNASPNLDMTVNIEHDLSSGKAIAPILVQSQASAVRAAGHSPTAADNVNTTVTYRLDLGAAAKAPAQTRAAAPAPQREAAERAAPKASVTTPSAPQMARSMTAAPAAASAGADEESVAADGSPGYGAAVPSGTYAAGFAGVPTAAGFGAAAVAAGEPTSAAAPAADDEAAGDEGVGFDEAFASFLAKAKAEAE